MRLLARPHVPDPPDLAGPLVRASGVEVRYGTRSVLHRVDLEVAAGEVLALVGPNGAGKSTLLGALAGDLATAGGLVEVAGRSVDGWSSLELAMRRAVLPQAQTLSFPFTAEQVVRMGRAPWAGTEAAELDDVVVAGVAARADVTELLPRRYHTLSGGERARVALARVLAQRTPVLLLDEPTAALDIRHQELVMAAVRERASEGVAVIAVVHDLALAAAHADRVALLARGRLVADGAPDDVLTPGLLGDVYHHEVDVFPHPRTGLPVVVPVRA